MSSQRLKPESLLASPSYQYGSVPPTQEVQSLDRGLLEPDKNTSYGIGPRRRGNGAWSRATTILLTFGLLLWISIHVVEQRGMEAGYFDNDDDNFQPLHSLAKLLPVPLLGRSHNDRAQYDATYNRDNLYVDPGKMPKHSQNKPIEEQLQFSHHVDSDIEIQAPEGCEISVIIMRHCEKGHIREHCNYLGYERSAYLTTLFGGDTEARWPAPSYIFAEDPGMRRNREKMNFRELETVLPLSKKFDLKVDTSYSTLDTLELAQKVQEMMRSGELCGKLVVISWKHSKLPKLAQALGCGPMDGCPTKYRGKDFDSLWQLKFVYRTPLHSSRKHLKAPTHKKWNVFGSVQAEGFDPLAFSKTMGDYPLGGVETGARWMALDNQIPERAAFDKKDEKH